jgi:hypothetical protein
MKNIALFFVFFISFQSVPHITFATGNIYYVDISGCDCNSGTADSPFLTIQYAADLMMPGDRCIVGGGEYYENVVPGNSGTEMAPISFVAASGEKVIISGTMPVTSWIRHSGEIWKARMDWSLGKNNQVFYNGIMLNEARWPNKPHESDIMTPSGAKITSADPGGIYCDDFPSSFPGTDSWEGTVIWVMANSKWTSWSRPVEGYDAAGKKILFEIPDISNGRMNPAVTREAYLGDHGDEFYLVNNFVFLDFPGEWYYNEQEQMLYMIPPDSSDPNDHIVAAKKRMTAFDLEGKSFIHIAGFDIHASSINMENARNCTVRDVRASYISHSRGGVTSYSLGEKTGIYVSGTGNTIRDSEISFSVEHGIRLGGTRNSVINCHIHNINYFGCYGTPVSVTGYKNMVSHCSIHETGRDGIQVSGQAHLIKHNHVFNVGLIAHDLGMIYTVGNDGGGTEIRHNVFHDNLSEGLQLGLYLDNFTSNYICHHNVVWGVDGDPLRFNKPSEYNIMAHNTAFGNMNNWGRWSTDGMFGDIVINNLLTGTIVPHPEYQLSHNLTGVSLNFASPLSAATNQRHGIDQGIYIPGITGLYSGEAPDIGAYESGLPPWKAGHDFDNPPTVVYRLSETPLRNRIHNACFELSSFIEASDRLTGWERTDAGKAEIIRGSGGISENPSTRDTYIFNGVKLSGNSTDGILQKVKGLEPNTTYVLAGWLKTGDAGEIMIGVRNYGGAEKSKSVIGTNWQQPVLEFTTGEGYTQADVFIKKSGVGTAFADNIGLVPAFLYSAKKDDKGF